MVKPGMAENGRGLAASGGGDFAPSASRDFSPPRGSAPGSSTTPSVAPRAGYSLRLKGKEGSRLGSRNNPREWDLKVRKVRRAPRKYYGPWVRGRARSIGGIERIIWRISGLNGGDRSKSLEKSGTSRSR